MAPRVACRYPLYWSMSVNDWYWASGDTARFLTFVPDMKRIIDHVIGERTTEFQKSLFSR